jgi:hypothetical protein
MHLGLQGWGFHVSFQRVATVRTTRVRTGAVANDPKATSILGELQIPQRLGQFSGAIDEELRCGTERPVFQGHDADGPRLEWQLNRQGLKG